MLQFPAWKRVLVVGICLAGMVLALPNLWSEEGRMSLPGWMPRDAVNLGLDLQGGPRRGCFPRAHGILRRRGKDSAP